jgi:hypothetical protein
MFAITKPIAPKRSCGFENIGPEVLFLHMLTVTRRPINGNKYLGCTRPPTGWPFCVKTTMGTTIRARKPKDVANPCRNVKPRNAEKIAAVNKLRVINQTNVGIGVSSQPRPQVPKTPIQSSGRRMRLDWNSAGVTPSFTHTASPASVVCDWVVLKYVMITDRTSIELRIMFAKLSRVRENVTNQARAIARIRNRPVSERLPAPRAKLKTDKTPRATLGCLSWVDRYPTNEEKNKMRETYPDPEGFTLGIRKTPKGTEDRKIPRSGMGFK